MDKVFSPQEGNIHPTPAQVAKKQYLVHHHDALHEMRYALTLPQVANIKRQPLLPKVASTYWSLAEDKLLLKLEERRGDLFTGYMTQHRANPLVYPKCVTDTMLRARVLELRSNSRRTTLLKSIMDEGSSFHSVNASPSPSRGATMTATASLSKASTGNEGGSNNVVLRCTSRDSSIPEEIVVPASKIVRNSPFLRDLLAREEEGGEGGQQKRRAVVVAGSQKYLELSEKDEMWNAIPNMYRVFASDNIMRYVSYCANPSAVTQKVEIDRKLNEAKEIQNKSWQKFVKEVETMKQEARKEFNSQVQVETENITKQFQEAKLKDIKAIEAIYDAHLSKELSWLKTKQEAEIKDFDNFLSQETTTLQSLSEVYEDIEVTKLKQECEQATTLFNKLFDRENLCRLLMLADVLQASELRSACVAEIANNLSFFATRSELSSQLLRANTIRELMSNLTDGDVFSLEELKETAGLPSHFIKEEFQRRKAIAVTKFRAMPKEELLALWNQTMEASHRQQQQQGESSGLDSSSAQMDLQQQLGHEAENTDTVAHILYSVLAEKQKAEKNAGVGLATFTLHRYSQNRGLMDPKGRVLELKAHGQFVTAEGNGKVRIGESVLKSYWECTIRTLNSRYPATICVGFDVPSSPGSTTTTAASLAGSTSSSFRSTKQLPSLEWGLKQSPCVGTVRHERGAYGSCITNDGYIYFEGISEDSLMTFGMSDVIGIALDHLTGILTFYKNGYPIAMPSRPQGMSGFTMLKRNESYVPCVTLYSASVDQWLKVEMELSGPFRYAAPEGHHAFVHVAEPTHPSTEVSSITATSAAEDI